MSLDVDRLQWRIRKSGFLTVNGQAAVPESLAPELQVEVGRIGEVVWCVLHEGCAVFVIGSEAVVGCCGGKWRRVSYGEMMSASVMWDEVDLKADVTGVAVETEDGVIAFRFPASNYVTCIAGFLMVCVNMSK